MDISILGYIIAGILFLGLIFMIGIFSYTVISIFLAMIAQCISFLFKLIWDITYLTIISPFYILFNLFKLCTNPKEFIKNFLIKAPFLGEQSRKNKEREEYLNTLTPNEREKSIRYSNYINRCALINHKLSMSPVGSVSWEKLQNEKKQFFESLPEDERHNVEYLDNELIKRENEYNKLVEEEEWLRYYKKKYN